MKVCTNKCLNLYLFCEDFFGTYDFDDNIMYIQINLWAHMELIFSVVSVILLDDQNLGLRSSLFDASKNLWCQFKIIN